MALLLLMANYKTQRLNLLSIVRMNVVLCKCFNSFAVLVPNSPLPNWTPTNRLAPQNTVYVIRTTRSCQ
eukprot:scaffold4157_cov136-Cylindrotheca_fusiformis.AAC.10